jgi:hypothetical protein
LKLLSTFTLFILLISCGGEDEFITFPSGNYLSDCIEGSSNSTKIRLTFNRSFRSQREITLTYSSSTDCSGEFTEGDSEESDIRFVFSNTELGNKISFFTNELNENSIEYHAFTFANRRLLISESLTGVKEEDLKNEFSDFISDPEEHAERFLNQVIN